MDSSTAEPLGKPIKWDGLGQKKQYYLGKNAESLRAKFLKRLAFSPAIFILLYVNTHSVSIVISYGIGMTANS